MLDGGTAVSYYERERPWATLPTPPLDIGRMGRNVVSRLRYRCCQISCLRGGSIRYHSQVGSLFGH